MNSVKKVALTLSVLIVTGIASQVAFTTEGNKIPLSWEHEKIDKDNAERALLLLSNSLYLEDINSILSILDIHWDDAYIAPLLDTVSLHSSPLVSKQIYQLLKRKTDKDFSNKTSDWFYWLWNQPEQIASNYADFKADLYKKIDPKFKKYFHKRQAQSRIRLDEIRWGGVAQDGIPPLRYPNMLDADDADYLDDDNVVFGIEVNGDVRAYPKRILAWHEMFIDTIGGVEIAGVYCTLCGTVIPYKTTINGVRYELGTSGFLYRSNKLMYDKTTQSLWSTSKGEPVVGPLVDKGIALEHLGVVTTTWGEWKRRHPNTRVLSLDTGHHRNYGEGVAYHEYFSTDKLMFNTPFSNKQLKNKQEVLALRFPASPSKQLAIDTNFLTKNPLYKTKIGLQKVLILTDHSGANRVYDPKGVEFVRYDQDKTLTDSFGATWQLKENQLLSEDGQQKLTSLPFRRAFWFGWYAAFPETKLIK